MRISNNSNRWTSFQLMTLLCNLFNISLWQSRLASWFHLWMWPFTKMKNKSEEQRMRMVLPAKEPLIPLRTRSRRSWRLILLKSWGRSLRWLWTAYRLASFNPWGCKLCKYKTPMEVKKISWAALNGLTGFAGLPWPSTTSELSHFWSIITQCS